MSPISLYYQEESGWKKKKKKYKGNKVRTVANTENNTYGGKSREMDEMV